MTKQLRRATLVALLTVAGASHAPPASAQRSGVFPAAQLEQLVAPIALYPDPLLTQVLMASTYPLEVVEASRWVRSNPGLSAGALDNALKDTDWDPSVKSLCLLPDVLNRMDENLEWTQDLGDAFLAQEADVLAAVQRMRNIAYEAGNLRSSEQQRVVVQERVVVIQPAVPEVIYVPVYSPMVVYGPSWGYPTYYYPSFYLLPPPGHGLFSFGLGVAIGAALWGDCDWGHWGGHGYYGGRGIFINLFNYNHFNRRTHRDWRDRDRDDDRRWHHRPEHRRGVNYRDPETANRFGAVAGSTRVTREQARDFDAGKRSGGDERRQIEPRSGSNDGARDSGGRRAVVPAPGGGVRDSGGRREVIPAPGGGARDSGGRREVIPAPGGGARDSGGRREVIPAPGGGTRDSGARREISPRPEAQRDVVPRSGSQRSGGAPAQRETPRPGAAGAGSGRGSSADLAPRPMAPGRVIDSRPPREIAPAPGIPAGARGTSSDLDRGVRGPSAPAPSRGGADPGPLRGPMPDRSESGAGGSERGARSR